MICRNCGNENKPGSKYCAFCGAMMESKNSAPVKGGTTVLSGTTNDYQSVYPANSEEETIWYFAENGTTLGPVNRSSILSMISSGRLNENSLVWRNGLDDWTAIKETELAPYISQIPVVKGGTTVLRGQPQTNTFSKPYVENNQSKGESPEWYYSLNNETFGPCTEKELSELMNSGQITQDTYIWKDGMPDWQLYKEIFNSATIGSGTPSIKNNSPIKKKAEKQMNSENQYNSGVKTKSIPMSLLLLFITCGIYYCFWLYRIAEDINTVAREKNVEGGTSGIAAVLFTLLSCGIYQIYFYWKEENAVLRLKQSCNQDGSSTLLVVILGIFFPIAALCIIQDQLNSVIRAS